MRPLCKCGLRPRAINYIKNKKTYYRSLCELCMAHGLYYRVPRWLRAGYKMKSICERCGFQSKYQEVFRVFHVDGNLDNCRYSNLKTVCANCANIISKEGLAWKQGDLIADF